MSKTLLVIDPQNDYFPEGKFPLWNTAATLRNIEATIAKAHSSKVPVIIIQHIASNGPGLAPFFNAGTPGVEVHPRILAAAPEAPVIVTTFADGFLHTTLEEILDKLGTTDLLICGMMTQNCVTHTAISRSAEKYKVAIIADCCTTVSEILHKIALNAVSTRVSLMQSSEAF